MNIIDSIKNINVIQELDFILTKFIRIAIIIILMYLTIKIGNMIIKIFVVKGKKSKIVSNQKKLRTLGAVSRSILKYSVYFFGIMAIFGQFGVISLTFAGIGGVAVGLGAQNIIKDIINGFFILFEDQFSVGDFIDIDDKSGIVESIGLRVTKLRDFNGDLHIIPNGLISKVTNHSRGDMRIMVDIDIASSEDMDKTIKVINEVCSEFKRSNDNVIDVPKVSGIADIKENGYTVRIIGKVKPMTQWDCESNLRIELKKALDKANIQSPQSKIQIVKEG